MESLENVSSRPREVIESIRRRWGIDLPAQLDAETRATIEHLRRQMGNSLELLSEQLYQSETHFFLEILQNADDNEYASDVSPSLTVTVQPGNITFENNERGFNEQEVEALCGLGNSTKKRRKTVQIGEKGIGFKAVFQVSDKPEIRSNGFRFRFDRIAHGNLGLVIPELLDEPVAGQSGTGTCITLPLRDGARWRLEPDQLKPELLLFLRRLRRLFVKDLTQGWSLELIREDSGGISTVRRIHKTSSGQRSEQHSFFVHRRPVVMDAITEKLRADVRETEVVIALPMSDDGAAAAQSQRDVFAFLPVTQVGFRFVCHADFVLVTNREEVLRGRPWNDRLRDELGIALGDALVSAQSAGALGRTALRFLTDPRATTNEFFRPILAGAVTRLKTKTCVPVESAGWETPAGAMRRDDAGLSQLVDASSLKTQRSRAFVDASVTGIKGALELLGCEAFTLDHLATFLNDTTWASAREPKWFAWLYMTLARMQLSDADSKTISKSNVVRLASGQVVPATTKSLFRSIASRTSYGFEEELQLVDPEVLRKLEAGAAEGVSKLLAAWGIRDANATTIIEKHILTVHSAPDWSKRPPLVLMGHLRYVRDHLSDYLQSKKDASTRESAMESLRANLHVRTQRHADASVYFDRVSNLYLSAGFRDPWRLRDLLGDGIDAISVSSAYVTGNTDALISKDREKWGSFLETLGAHTLPRVVRQNGDWVPSSEVVALMQSTDWDRKRRLLKLLDSTWATIARWCRRTDSSRKWAAEVPTSFLTTLQDMEIQTSTGDIAKLSDCYLKTEEVFSVFGTSVPYLIGDWESQDFLRTVGVVTSPSVRQVIERLDALGREGHEEAVYKRDASRLYKFLDARFEGHEQEIHDAFYSNQVVFVPRHKDTYWNTLNECCWSVPKDLEPYLPVRGLQSDWGSLQEFFCDKLALREDPTADEWVFALEKMSQSKELSGETAGRMALRVYRRLNTACSRALEAGEEPAWMQKLRTGAFIWTHRGEWWRNESDTFVADDAELLELFANVNGVGLLDMPSDEIPGIASVIQVLGLPVLSRVVTATPPSGSRSCDEQLVVKQIQRRWTALARYLWHKHYAKYVLVSDDGRLGAMRTIDVTSYEPLEMQVELREHRAKKLYPAWCDLDDSGAWLYLDRASRNDWDAIGIELCRVLGLADTEGMTIGRILAAGSDTEVNELLRKLRVSDLPPVEKQRWGLIEAKTETGMSDDDVRKSEEEERYPEAVLEPSEAKDGDFASIRAEGTTEANPIESKSSSRLDGANSAIDATHAATATYDEPSISPRESTPANRAEQAISVDEDEGDAKHSSQEVSSAAASGSGGGKGLPPSDSTLQGAQPGGRKPGPPTRPDRAGVESAQRRSGSSTDERLRSYVERGSEETSGDLRTGSENDREPEDVEVATAAIRHVLAWEARAKRVPTDENERNPNYQGYDITSCDAAGHVVRYIEVKGVRAEWGKRGVMVTPKQFDFAARMGHLAWLYVVEHALSDTPRIHCIQNFAQRVWRFGFDDGWREVEEAVQPVAWGPPTVGLHVRLTDGRVGTVSAVFGAGTNQGVELLMGDNGPPIRVPWQPTRITLVASTEET